MSSQDTLADGVQHVCGRCVSCFWHWIDFQKEAPEGAERRRLAYFVFVAQIRMDGETS